MTQGFPEEPVVEIMADGINMRLLKDFVYVSKAGARHVARAGLVTNGGSVPVYFWRSVGAPWTGVRRYAYIIHDQDCEDVRLAPEPLQAGMRMDADLLLREMSLFLGDTPRMARVVFWGVRIGWYWSSVFGAPVKRPLVRSVPGDVVVMKLGR